MLPVGARLAPSLAPSEAADGHGSGCTDSNGDAAFRGNSGGDTEPADWKGECTEVV